MEYCKKLQLGFLGVNLDPKRSKVLFSRLGKCEILSILFFFCLDQYNLKKTGVETTGSKISPIRADGFCSGLPGNPLMIREFEKFGSPYNLIRIDVGGLKSRNCGGVRTSSSFVPRFRDWIEENLDWKYCSFTEECNTCEINKLMQKKFSKISSAKAQSISSFYLQILSLNSEFFVQV